MLPALTQARWVIAEVLSQALVSVSWPLLDLAVTHCSLPDNVARNIECNFGARFGARTVPPRRTIQSTSCSPAGSLPRTLESLSAGSEASLALLQNDGCPHSARDSVRISSKRAIFAGVSEN